MLDAGQRLAGGQLYPAMFREIMSGEPDCGLWHSGHKESARAWLEHISGCMHATLEELRSHVDAVRAVAALN